MKFVSHRSTLTCVNGCVASSQTLASQIGIDTLKKGGNAADAAVAVAAALNVTQPCSTGIGGDVFCLYYNKKSNSIQGLNASGRAPESLTLKHVHDLGFNEDNKLPITHGFAVTVPGACAGWVDCVEKFGSGSLSMKDILGPSIEMARCGFPVSGPITARLWAHASPPLLKQGNRFGKELLIEDTTTGNFRPPVTGEIFKNPGLADVFESVACDGKDGFYKGRVADAIVRAVKEHGGVIAHKDLAEHSSEVVSPICAEYKGLKLWEIPPNGQGIVALETLNILKNFDLSSMKHNSGQYLHRLIEAIRLSFADAMQYCADPTQCHVPIEGLLDKDYGKSRANLIREHEAMSVAVKGIPPSCHGDTVYFTTADKDGNVCSFINSNFMGFGTGIVPEGCGFSLQNRGCNFSLKEDHPNAVASKKRPYHTIIPAMVTDAETEELVMSYGVMGGFMQPQGHVQVLLNMLEFGMDPQEALDAPRFLVGSGHSSPFGEVYLEEGIEEDAQLTLASLGHSVQGPVSGFARQKFGRGHIIAKRQFWLANDTQSPVYWAASDPRSDGVAVGY